MQIKNNLNDSRECGCWTFSRGPVSNWDDNWDITSRKLLVISLNNNFKNCDLNSTKSAFVVCKIWRYNTLVTMTKDKSQHSNRRENSISHFSVDFHANHRRWHICFILALSSLTGSSEIENKMIQSARLRWEADWEMVREGERREWNTARSQGDNPFDWGLRPDATQNVCQCAEKGAAREGSSIRPLHRNRQDVWTQLCASQTPLEPKSSTATMSRLKYSINPDKIYGCLCAGLPTYLCTSTDLYLPMRLMVGLVCQCLSMIMFDYVSRFVYINEIGILVCWRVCIHLFVCMCVYDGGGERWRVENWSRSELLQSEPVWLPKKTVVGRVC